MRFPPLGPIIHKNLEEVFIYNRSLTLLFFTNMGYMWGMNLVSPFLPLFIRSLGASIFETGLVISLSGIGATVLVIPGGILADRFGRKRLLLISLILGAVSIFMFTLVDEWLLLIPLMLIFRSSFSLNMPARSALITDVTRRENRAGIFGIMSLSFPLGGVLGPLLGGFLIDSLSWTPTFYLITFTVALSTLPITFLRESGRSVLSESLKVRVERSALIVLATFFLITTVVTTGFGAVQPLLPLYLTERFAASKTMVGFFFTLTYLPLFTMVYSGALADRIGRKRIMASALALTTPLFILCAMADGYNQLALLYVLIYLFRSMTWPASQALLMDQTPTTIRGLAVGIRMTGMRIGFTLGPLVGAYLWEVFDPTTPFYASAFFVAMAIPLVLTLRE